ALLHVRPLGFTDFIASAGTAQWGQVMLKTGKVSPQEVANVLKKSSGKNHSSSLHHQDSSIEVHVIKCRAWYVKFYFDPDTVFISVHQ
ncbi:hypothetical protein VDP62_21505, partial [Xanthomonas campestris pv. campestris]|nr:hypothetical protein [Xanthomonas campestris pv. campestris]MEB1245921.1 hypothetical protein [Xanthomonas campestris pv. campestris]MEB1254219.1 hypothetical protein [Xanthomonas campestris pv. campestris]MEB1295518.1 hypothetical protein [Xanthomonas campestris pv. campestris]